MNIKVIGLSCCIFILASCSSRSCQEDRIALVIDSLIKSSSFPETYKAEQIKYKKALLSKVCGKIESKGKIIFMEYVSKEDFLNRGVIFDYSHNNIYTYVQDNEKVKIAKDYKYDNRQVFKGSFSYFKDSTLERLTFQSNRNLLDATTYKVFYLDFTKNDFRLFKIK